MKQNKLNISKSSSEDKSQSYQCITNQTSFVQEHKYNHVNGICNNNHVIEVNSEQKNNNKRNRNNKRQILNIPLKKVYNEEPKQLKKPKNKNTFICNICKKIYPIKQSYSLGCTHYSCQQCLHNYIIQKIQQNNKVECKQKDCHINLNYTSILFLNLPGQIQSKYKIFYNYIASLDRIKVNISQEDSQHNTHLFDGKRILGSKYRSCKQCSKIIHKQPNNLKLTCEECKKSFCYLCQKTWQNNNHQCQYLIAIHQQNSKEKRQRWMLIPVVLVVWMVLIFGVLMPRVMIKGVMYLVISVASGMTFYACMYVWKQQKTYKKVILLILYPISLIIGVGMASTIFFTTLLMEEMNFVKQIQECLPQF